MYNNIFKGNNSYMHIYLKKVLNYENLTEFGHITIT